MTVLLHDDFAGALDDPLNGRAPPTQFEAIVWNGGGLLDGAGGVAAEGYYGPPDDFSTTGVSYPFANVHSNPTITEVECVFVWKTAASLTIVSEYEIPGLVVEITLNGGRGLATINATHNTGTGVTSWFLNLLASAGGPVDITADIAAATSYTGTLTVASGAQSVTFAGHTLTAADPATDAAGLSNLAITLGGLHRLMDITVGPPEFLQEMIASAPSPLGAPAALAYHDFSAAVSPLGGYSVMDLITPGGPVRVPISSWQATLQTTDANYVQCVVPACTAWQDTINAATEFVIYRRAALTTGEVVDYEMVRAPLEQINFDRGPSRHTATLSGYSPGFAEDLDPPDTYDRTLAGVRSISSSVGNIRVRCAVDWLLRPGHRAFVDAAPFVVGYINYYAPSGFDAYMDVGS